MRILILNLLGLVFLSGCIFDHGDQTCGQACEMSPDKTEYIFGNICAAPNISVPTEYVKSCYSCSDKSLVRDGALSLALSYPDFMPVTDFSAGNSQDKISIWITTSPCTPPYTLQNSQTRSERIKAFLNDRMQSKYDQLSPPKHISGNLYVITNSAKFSADEEIFYSKTSQDRYEFVAICHSYGCSSNSNPIEATPSYSYEYNFSKPLKIEDIVVIHRAVKDYVMKIYAKKP